MTLNETAVAKDEYKGKARELIKYKGSISEANADLQNGSDGKTSQREYLSSKL